MKYIIIITKNHIPLEDIRNIYLPSDVEKYFVNDTRLAIDYGGEGHLFFDDVGVSLREDYEHEEIQLLPFKKPYFITLVYTSMTKIKMIEKLLEFRFPKDFYIDNDYNLKIRPIYDFIELNNKSSDETLI